MTKTINAFDVVIPTKFIVSPKTGNQDIKIAKINNDPQKIKVNLSINQESKLSIFFMEEVMP
jgi:hypothetical protein